jgi:hypothetical protein
MSSKNQEKDEIEIIESLQKVGALPKHTKCLRVVAVSTRRQR